MPKADAVFAIDGYEVSATFAEKRNQAALSQVKQILLSSFANNASKARPVDILALSPQRSDNVDGGRNYVTSQFHSSDVLIRALNLTDTN